MVIIDYMTDAKSAAAMLPEDVTTLPVPDLPGFSAVKHIWAHYRDSSFGPYDEFIVGIPCLYKGELYIYVPFIYVTTDAAMAAGREIGGWPKKIADIKLERAGNNYRLSFRRGSAELNATAIVGAKLFSTPLPAKEALRLHYPHNLTLPLPAPTGKEQASVPLPTMSLKVIPGIGAANPKPVVAQLISAKWGISGDFHAAKGVTVSMHSSEEDPFEKLPLLRVVGGTYVSGDMTLAMPEMKVLEDWLK
jgi:acetoacetate decarboxylase